MARLTLTTPGEDVIVGGAEVDVIGTASGGETIEIIRGDIRFDASFNRGGDVIALPGMSSGYTVQLVGSTVVIDGATITITVPIGPAGIDIAFDDETFDLRVDTTTAEAMIGDQVITSVPQPLDGVGGPPPAATTPIIQETGNTNDVFSLAQPIERNWLKVANNPLLEDDSLPSATIKGSISSNSDRDFFRISLQEGELLIVDVDGTTGGLDALLRLFGPNGQELLEADDAALDPGSLPHPFSPTGSLDSMILFRAPSSGTYTFSIESWDNSSSGTYNLHVSIGPPASLAQIIAEDVAAMQSGFTWNDPDLTYGFPTSPSQFPPGSTDGEQNDNFGAFNPNQQAAVLAALGQYAAISGLSFEAAVGNPALADLRYALSDQPETAYASYPTGSPRSGSSWYNNSSGDFVSPLPGNYAWATILHETGHALGLKHPHESTAVSLGRDSLEYSVMSYRSYIGASVGDDGGYTNEIWGFPQTLMMYDIAAIQQMYGANFGHASGNDVYSWNPQTGQMSINGVGQQAPGANRVFMTIWDGGGNDTYDLSNYTTAVRIDLRPGEWTFTSSVQLANLGDGSMARGNIANALQFEGDPRSLIENAIGGSGNDRITANEATNSLTGNGGADIFIWNSIEDADIDKAPDRVTDFTRGSDRIDLSWIDAVSGTGTNDPFEFIGSTAFSGDAGELRFVQTSGSVRIEGDVDGDGLPDFHILLEGIATVGAADFIL